MTKYAHLNIEQQLDRREIEDWKARLAELRRAGGNLTEESRICNVIAKAFERFGDPKSALRYNLSDAEICAALEDKLGHAVARGNMADNYYSLLDFENAQENRRLHLGSARAAGNNRATFAFGTLYMNWAAQSKIRRQEYLGKAADFFREAHQLVKGVTYEELRDDNAKTGASLTHETLNGDVCINFSNYFDELNDTMDELLFEKSLEHLNKAYAVAKKESKCAAAKRAI